jgi:hypothetical protein
MPIESGLRFLRTHSQHTVIFALAAALLTAQTPPDALRIIQDFRRISAQDLWPGFKPAETPVEFFDGSNTWLLNHPSAPEGFRPMAGVPGVFLYRGQHDSVRANTGTKLNGVPTATADFSQSKAPAEEQAATLIHEAFHVFEGKSHPNWSANEASLFTYPTGDAELLSLRRLETAALVRAIHADATGCQTAALSFRARRFQRLPPESVSYERAVERTEGLAQYVEFRSIGRPAALSLAFGAFQK